MVSRRNRLQYRIRKTKPPQPPNLPAQGKPAQGKLPANPQPAQDKLPANRRHKATPTAKPLQFALKTGAPVSAFIPPAAWQTQPANPQPAQEKLPAQDKPPQPAKPPANRNRHRTDYRQTRSRRRRNCWHRADYRNRRRRNYRRRTSHHSRRRRNCRLRANRRHKANRR